jgi:hypothetical protein
MAVLLSDPTFGPENQGRATIPQGANDAPNGAQAQAGQDGVSPANRNGTLKKSKSETEPIVVHCEWPMLPAGRGREEKKGSRYRPP